jgi:glutamyl-tRNA synthetase
MEVRDPMTVTPPDTDKIPVRVRYAPSPTGQPHLGNIRTALFDWLLARRTGGTFILRIEDTDQARLVPGALAAIMESLEWLGLEWDEGPEGYGGDSRGSYGPYFQSQRLHIYQDIVQQLLEKEAAYRCDCTPQRLTVMRRQQEQEKRPPGYDGHCRDRSLGDETSPVVVRFRMPREGTTVFHDLVRGEVKWQNALLDDMVILKSDGFPTYHLANVVDDHTMEISHVVRGEEWIPSTPRHVLLYRTLGWNPPAFAHTSIINGPDRTKLSKRHGETATLAYREMGFLPEAIVNFLGLLGWSLDDKTEVISRSELVANFSLDRLTKAPAIFDREKLTWLNGVYIRDLNSQELAQRLLPFLERPSDEGGISSEVPRPLDMDLLCRIVPLVQERLKTLTEGSELVSFFFQEELFFEASQLIQKGMDGLITLHALEIAQDKLRNGRLWSSESLESTLRPLAEELGLKTGQFFGLLRMAVTGRAVSPPLFETMEVLGQARCLKRIADGVMRLSLL